MKLTIYKNCDMAQPLTFKGETHEDIYKQLTDWLVKAEAELESDGLTIGFGRDGAYGILSYSDNHEGYNWDYEDTSYDTCHPENYQEACEWFLEGVTSHGNWRY